MKNFILVLLIMFFSTANAGAAVWTNDDKVKNAIIEVSGKINKDSNLLKENILNNALSALTDETEIDYETDLVIAEIDKKFINKSKKDLIAILASTLLSDSGSL